MSLPRAPVRDTAWRPDRGAAAAALLILTASLLIIALPVPISAGVLVAPIGAIALIAYPVLIPVALIASVPVQDAIPVPESIPITATRIASLATVAVLPLILARRRIPVRWSWFLLAVLLLMATMVLSLWNAEFLNPGYAELYRWFVALATFWIVLQFIRTERQIMLMIGLTGILVLAQGGIGIVQALIGAGPASFQLDGGFSRSFGSFGMPNSFAAYMEVATLPLIPIAVLLGQRAVDSWRDYRLARLRGFLPSSDERHSMLLNIALFALIASSAVVGLAAIALSFSRGGWLGTIAAVVVIVILLGRRALFLSALSAIVLAIAFMATAPGAVVGEVQERFEQLVDQVQIGDVRRVPVTDENFAVIERMSHWQTAVAMWDEHPWIGVGIGNYNERFTEFAVHPQFVESQGHAHNYYLHMLAETGVVGLLVYLGFLIAALAVGWRAFKSPDRLARALGIGAIGMTTALIVHNVFENLHVLNISMHMMLVWALAFIATWRATSAHPGTDSTLPETGR